MERILKIVKCLAESQKAVAPFAFHGLIAYFCGSLEMIEE